MTVGEYLDAVIRYIINDYNTRNLKVPYPFSAYRSEREEISGPSE